MNKNKLLGISIIILFYVGLLVAVLYTMGAEVIPYLVGIISLAGVLITAVRLIDGEIEIFKDE